MATHAIWNWHTQCDMVMFKINKKVLNALPIISRDMSSSSIVVVII